MIIASVIMIEASLLIDSAGLTTLLMLMIMIMAIAAGSPPDHVKRDRAHGEHVHITQLA